MQAFIELVPCRFDFTAIDRIHLPAGKSGNTLRGAVGSQLMSSPTCEPIFAPASATGPSGYADPPRPFVLRAAHLDGRTFEPGESFHLDLNLFDLSSATRRSLFDAIDAMARERIGPGRGRAHLEAAKAETVKLSLCPWPDPVDRVQVRFLTPTELKAESRIVQSPDFHVLFARARDRISSLCALYGARPLRMDFRGIGDRAANVRMTRCEVQHIDTERRSSRTGQVHPLGGFTGEAEYEGDLREFMPFLEAAYWTGVGRHTVWGNGWIKVVRPA